jgi:hypothetical protein
MSNELAVTSYENRAGENPENVAYGFVYFNDGTRVAYSTEAGVVKDATGGGDPVTDQHVKVAKAYLKKKGVLVTT